MENEGEMQKKRRKSPESEGMGKTQECGDQGQERALE